MVKRRTATVQLIEFDVDVRQEDIEKGECRLTRKCMEKLAIARALIDVFPNEQVKDVRLDAGHIKFIAGSYRWIANTPRIARRSLIQFDNPRTSHLVKPHSYKVTAQRTTKLIPNPRERQDQINKARRQRIAAGIPDKNYTARSLRKRIIGFR